MRTLVMGLGNPILTDDSVGLVVARQVYDRALSLVESRGDELALVEASVAGLNILDLIQGFDKVVVIDSVQTSNNEVGELYRVSLDDISGPARLKSPHGIDFALAIEMGRAVGADVPSDIRIYAVEVADPFTFGERLTPKVAAAVPTVVAKIVDREFGQENA